VQHLLFASLIAVVVGWHLSHADVLNSLAALPSHQDTTIDWNKAMVWS
jgi:hypothetical protein